MQGFCAVGHPNRGHGLVGCRGSAHSISRQGLWTRNMFPLMDLREACICQPCSLDADYCTHSAWLKTQCRNFFPGGGAKGCQRVVAPAHSLGVIAVPGPCCCILRLAQFGPVWRCSSLRRGSRLAPSVHRALLANLPTSHWVLQQLGGWALKVCERSKSWCGAFKNLTQG